MPSSLGPVPEVQVGVIVLNYHHPLETLVCVQCLLMKEPSTTRILWVENGAGTALQQAMDVIVQADLPYQLIDPLQPSLPGPGIIGLILNNENLGYAGGNNVGLRLLHSQGVPFAWVLNNDTQLLEGNSELLVAAALDRPQVAIWGTTILATHHSPVTQTVPYMGGRINLKDFSIALIARPDLLENDPMTFVSGCSLFAATKVLASLQFIPDDYFLYYEDPALTFEARKQGFLVSGVPEVKVFHLESLSTGRRSPLMEFYNRRNRWHFIQRYFPAELARQRRGIWYRIQKWIFRGEFDRLRIEILALIDFQKGRIGRTHRTFSRSLPK